MNDDELERRITDALDEGAARLDASTRSRLALARHRALSARHTRRWLLPATGGAVLASVIAATLWVGRPVTAPMSLEPQDFELLTAGDRLDLYQELDFLRWLEETGGGNAG